MFRRDWRRRIGGVRGFMAARAQIAALPCLRRGPSLWDGEEGLGNGCALLRFAACCAARRQRCPACAGGRPDGTARKKLELRGDSLFYRFCAVVRRRFARRQKITARRKTAAVEIFLPALQGRAGILKNASCMLRVAAAVRWRAVALWRRGCWWRRCPCLRRGPSLWDGKEGLGNGCALLRFAACCAARRQRCARRGKITARWKTAAFAIFLPAR